MTDKKFFKIISFIMLLGLISSVALVVYTNKLHGETSIISIVANER
ncbi:MAG: hypothetical protein KBS84_00725 [Treponema sp.]|nr:hypothetical protein [Candidatus Treponema scatequi]